MTVRRLYSLGVLVLPLLATQGCATQALWEEFDDVTRDRGPVTRQVAPERVTRAARTGEGVYVVEVAYAGGERRSYTWTPALPTPGWPGSERKQCEPEDRAPPALVTRGQEFPAACPEGWLPLEVEGGEEWAEAPAPAPVDVGPVEGAQVGPAQPWPTVRLSASGLLEHREGREDWQAVARVPALEEQDEHEQGVDAGDVALGVVWVGLTPLTVAVDAVAVGAVVGLIGLIIPLALL